MILFPFFVIKNKWNQWKSEKMKNLINKKFTKIWIIKRTIELEAIIRALNISLELETFP